MSTEAPEILLSHYLKTLSCRPSSASIRSWLDYVPPRA